MAILALALTAALALHQPASRLSRVCTGTSRGRAHMKHVEAREARALSDGSICEFEDGKGNSRIGLVRSSKASGSKGFVYELVDVEEHVHTIATKAVHIAFPPNMKVKSTKPAEILKEYVAVASTKPIDLGIDVSLLGLAWEMCAEEDVPSHTTASIFNKIDPSLMESSIAQYKAYRLLASEIGHLFFKVLHETDHAHREYKARTADAVATTKNNWCESLGDKHSEEFCFA